MPTIASLRFQLVLLLPLLLVVLVVLLLCVRVQSSTTNVCTAGRWEEATTMASAAVSPTSSSNKRQRTDGTGTSAAGGGKARRRRVGVVGFGSLGQYLVNAILNDETVSKRMELAFVWNRSPGKLSTLASDKRLEKLAEFDSMGADLIIEVAHPSIIKQYGAKFAAAADLIIGSPTSMADAAVEAAIRKAADVANGFGVYIPSGALWGAQVRRH